MAKLTVAEIKKQIAALEAKAIRLAENETKIAVAKVRAFMDSLGVTIEHLTGTSFKQAAGAKKSAAGKRSTAKRTGAGVVRYRDPETGATWTGFGRAPGWIAAAADRESFAVSQTAAKAAPRPAKAKKPVSKRPTRSSADVKEPAKKSAAAGKRVAKSASSKPAAKQGAASKTTARKVAGRKASSKKVVASAAAATDTPETTPSN